MQLTILALVMMAASPVAAIAAEGESASQEGRMTHCVGTIRVSESCRDAHSAIQDAVNHTSSGDTVLVAAGEYYEHVVITTDGIRLLGATDADGEPQSILHDVFFPEQITIKGAGSVEIANFVILRKDHNANSPVGLDDAESNTIHNISIYVRVGRGAPTDDAEMAASGIAGVDDGGNRFYSVVVWEKQANASSVRGQRGGLETDALAAVAHRYATRRGK